MNSNIAAFLSIRGVGFSANISERDNGHECCGVVRERVGIEMVFMYCLLMDKVFLSFVFRYFADTMSNSKRMLLVQFYQKEDKPGKKSNGSQTN